MMVRICGRAFNSALSPVLDDSHQGRRYSSVQVFSGGAMAEPITQTAKPRTVTQFLTAVFELRPSRRKAAVLERVRAASEAAFWETMASCRPVADGAVGAEKKARRDAVAQITAAALRAGSRHRLVEPVAQGLARDVSMAASSYIELRSNGREAEWPVQHVEAEHAYETALDAFRTALTRDDENLARDEFSRVTRPVMPRPMTIARERDAQLLRERENGPVVAVLNIVSAREKAARTTIIKAGVNAATGEAIPAKKSATRLIVPISCSKWHENKFLSGRCALKSSIIYRKGERWFMMAQFAFETVRVETSGALGIDRGLVNTLSGAVVDEAGGVKAVLPISGSAVGEAIRAAEGRARAYQRRTGRTIPLHRRGANQILHKITNEIVARAKSLRSRVVMENLDGFKSALVSKRAKGARRSSWQKALKKAQLGKIEQMLAYKLALAGLPAVKTVAAGGTSVTCSACGQRDAKSRASQDRFECVACGHAAHADLNAAVQIARRGVMKVTKGDKLDDLHKNMVADLRKRGDGGLGPMAAGAAVGFVAGRVSVSALYDPSGLGAGAGQNVTSCDQNIRKDVLAEPVAPYLETLPDEKAVAAKEIAQGRGGAPPNVE